MKKSRALIRFNDFTEIKAIHTAPIVALLNRNKNLEAAIAFQGLCKSVKDLKDYEASLLARKILSEAGRGIPSIYKAKLVADWTDPEDKSHNHMVNCVFANDNECICGVNKHHYHCPVCGRISQVG